MVNGLQAKEIDDILMLLLVNFLKFRYEYSKDGVSEDRKLQVLEMVTAFNVLTEAAKKGLYELSINVDALNELYELVQSDFLVDDNFFGLVGRAALDVLAWIQKIPNLAFTHNEYNLVRPALEATGQLFG
jgi:hypothetical protein